jgi:hypothetical protein
MYDADAVFVEPVMELFVDGIERDDSGVREADAELEEQVGVPEERFVDVEEGTGVADRAEDGAWEWDAAGCATARCRGWRWLLDAPDGCRDVATPVSVATEDKRC